MPKYTITEVLTDRWWIALLAFGVSLILTPVVRFIAYRTKIVDRPDDLLKPHGRPVAYMGGVSMCIGLLAGLAGYMVSMPDLGANWAALTTELSNLNVYGLTENPLWRVLAVMVSSLLIMLVGLLDDLVNLKPRQKIYGQLLAAGILMLGGVATDISRILYVPLLGYGVAPWLIYATSAFMCFVLVVATCNATNLLDGLDGLCGGVTGIIALGFLALAVYLASWAHYPSTDGLRLTLCLAMAGAVVGFLPYNLPPASIFMGDAGSMLLGFFVATMMCLFCREETARWLLGAGVVFAVPIVDTGLAVVRRLLSGKNIFSGDRSHLYDQLVDRGMSVKKVVVIFYLLAMASAVVGVGLIINLRLRYSIVLCLLLVVAIAYILYSLGMVSPAPHQKKTPGDASKE